MGKLKCLIIDDEFNCRSNLQLLIEEYCPELEVAGLAESAEKARTMVKELDPDVVFLDIKMPGEDGFAFLKSMETYRFAVVFTTAHNQFALKAFKANAIDYLEKPIDVDDLKKGIAKIVKLYNSPKEEGTIGSEAVQKALDSLVTKKSAEIIAIPTSDGFVMARNEEIIYLEAEENYTYIYLTENRKYFSCGSIKRYEDVLDKNTFFRTHRSFIINVANHLKEFSRKEGNMVILTGNIKIPVARRTLPEFLNQINTI
jgi:two-component system LytT family response regulator